MPQEQVAALLKKIFSTDFREFTGDAESVRIKFMSHPLSMRDLHRAYRFIADKELVVPMPGEPEKHLTIPAAFEIGDPNTKEAVVQLAQVHGNEPVGLGVMLYGMALSEAGVLGTKIYTALGNHSAAAYFWEAWEDNPERPAAARSNTRTMIGEEDRMDLNRFLPDRARKVQEDFAGFMDEMLSSDNVMLRRGAKLCALVKQPEVSLVFDAHTSRQEPDGIRTINISTPQMQLLTEGKGDFGGLFRGVPPDIRVFPSGLLGKLGQSDPKITLKELLEAAKGKPVVPIIGIECGHHETLDDCVPRAARFFNALMYNMGLSELKPSGYDDDRGKFNEYSVHGRLPLNWLSGEIRAGDKIYPVHALGRDEVLPLLSSKQDVAHHFADPLQMIFVSTKGAELVTIESEAARQQAQGRLAAGEKGYLVYQFKEMEEIKKDQVVMAGVPSGAEMRAPQDMMIFFPTKSAYVYGNKPGMWPVEVKEPEVAGKAKFGYGIFEKKELTLPLEPEIGRLGRKTHTRMNDAGMGADSIAL